MGISKNSDFFVSARKHRADDCMDAGGRVMHGAITENRSVYDIHEDRPGWRTSTELPRVGAMRRRGNRGKKCIFRGAQMSNVENELWLM